MATTTRGRALTDAHRIAQARLGGSFLAASRILLDEINPARIDASLHGWAGLQVTLTEAAWKQSKDLAVEYLTEYRIAEVGRAGASMPIVYDFPFPAPAAAIDALWLGPVAKYQVTQGLAARVALRYAFDNNVGLSQQRRMLDGGRSLIDQSALANPASSGWRRVSDGDPCSFCAVLVGRGPTYRSKAAAEGARRYHDRCGCGVEEVLGVWAPTRAEQEYIDAYEAAHRPGDTIDDVAKRMDAAARAAR